MTPFRLDHDSLVPLVHQVARGIRSQITSGGLAPGILLPSVRDLGTMLDINFNTVAKAYRLLEREGLVEVRHGLGARVRETPLPAESAPRTESLYDELDAVLCRLKLAGAETGRIEQMVGHALHRYWGPLETPGEEP